jgi:hypothetical protein
LELKGAKPGNSQLKGANKTKLTFSKNDVEISVKHKNLRVATDYFFFLVLCFANFRKSITFM